MYIRSSRALVVLAVVLVPLLAFILLFARANPSSAAALPTATLTGNGSAGLVSNVGDSIVYAWSSTDGVSARSYFTVDSTDKCGHKGGVQYHWVASTLSGSKTAKVNGCNAGHTYTFTYIVTDAQGHTASATVVNKVNALPNIIVIMTDDMRWDDIETMPNVQHLIGDQGITFTNSFVTFSLCCAARASFLTGQYPHNHGITGNIPEMNGGYSEFMPQDGNTLPVWLQEVGYTTGLIGKYLNGYGDGTLVPTTYVPPGWNDWQGMPDALGTYHYFGFAINHNGTIESFNTDPSNYQTDVLGQRMIDFVNSAPGNKPFFLWFTPLAPHQSIGEIVGSNPIPAPRDKGTFASLPLPMPPNFNEANMSDKPAFMRKLPLISPSDLAFITKFFRDRRETLLAVDTWVGTLVNTLQAKGELDNTIIVFTSDNGWSQGEHRRKVSKLVVYEESIRVPLIIRGPGIPAGQTRAQLVNNVDVVATIIEKAHATAGHPQDGHSLTALFSNAQAPWRSALLVEGADVAADYLKEGNNLFTAVRTQNFVYAWHIASSEQEFYDLSSDPYELKSRQASPRYRHVVKGLVSILSKLKNCAGRSCWVITPEPSLPP